MTYTIDLPPAVEEIAAQQARAQGRSLSEYLPDLLAEAVIRRHTLPDSAPRPQTGAEAIAAWERDGAFLPDEGNIGTEDNQLDSPELARQIRQRAWGRR